MIPVLLLQGSGLVKTIKFSKTNYIGDPINAVKIFNDLGADELILLDITASIENRIISKELVKEIGDEAYMPFSVGGGISRIDQIKELLALGAEKVVLNSILTKDIKFLQQASEVFGNQSIIASVDVKKGLLGNYNVFSNSGKTKTKLHLFEYIQTLKNLGAGEIMINSIERDGTFSGYDLCLIKSISGMVSIPVIACGGAGSLKDMRDAYFIGGASACAAGSIFVYHGPRRGVLINYPEKKEIFNTFKNVI